LSDLPILDPNQLGSLLDLGADLDLVRELVGLFVEDVPPRLISIQKALAEGNVDQVMEDAHHLKGSLGNMGLLRFADLARQMEEEARAGSLKSAPELLEAMHSAFPEGHAALKEAFLER
jgi:HPt (histidine-containing phosphotransfer) domain-containing protein